jgi:hypothetical protein
MTTKLRRHQDVDRSRSGINFAEVDALPDAEKERLCRALLAEFGVTRIVRVTDKGEMIHCCSLPNHNETNASASLNFKNLTYKCYGCDQKGGLLWYIGTARGTSGTDAAKWLKDQTGLGNEVQSLAALLDYFESLYGGKGTPLAPIPQMHADVLKPWMRIHPYLTDPKAEGGRGIPEETVIRFRCGFGDFRYDLGHGNWITSQRIVVPHFWRGDLVGWQTRRLLKDGSPKYQSSADFPRDRTVFNYDESQRRVVVVESPMSVLSKAHLPVHIEATFGASVTDRQVRFLSNHPQVVLFMDNDEAGWKATESLTERLAPYCNVFVVESPYAADPADLDDGTYLSLVDGAIPAGLWTRPTELHPWEG